MEVLRWKQRFENLGKAHKKFLLALKAIQEKPKDELIQMALVQAFEFTYELSWKTLKDYLEYKGVVVSLPREVIKQAFHHQIIEDGQEWIDMLQSRNLLAHTYDDAAAKQAVEVIQSRYAAALQQVFDYLEKAP